MSYEPKNPYIQVEELIEELKLKPTDVVAGSTIHDDLLRSIDRGSRWVDNYTHRDYFYHDHTVTPLDYGGRSDNVIEDKVYLPYAPVIIVTRITLGDKELDLDADVQIDYQNGIIYSEIGHWLPRFPHRVLKVYGQFGGRQPFTEPVTVLGDDAGQITAITLTGLLGRSLGWALELVSGTPRLTLSDGDDVVAQGSGASSITLTEQNNSGISGTATVSYSADDTGTIEPQEPIVDESAVPENVPSRIAQATRLVAAAFSGRNRVEVVGVDGTKQAILTNEIPRTVTDLLGKRNPVRV